MPEVDEWVSLREFARRMRVTPNAITSALKSGRIVRREADKKIHWPTQSRAWDELRDLSKVRQNDEDGDELSEEPGESGEDKFVFRKAKTRREEAIAGLKEIELQTALGELVPAAHVRAAIAQMAIDIREGVMTIADRVAAEIANELLALGIKVDAESLRSVVHRLWRQESRAVLERIASAGNREQQPG